MTIDIIIEQLHEKIFQIDTLIPGFCKRNNLKSAGLSCLFVIPEVCAALGVFPSVVPALFTENCATGRAFSEELYQVYDFFAVAENCCGAGRDSSFYSFKIPSGYGEDASVRLHDEHKKLISYCGGRDIESLDHEQLSVWSAEYNEMRRLVRGICSARKNQPEALSHKDLSVVFSASLALPPQMVLPSLRALSGLMQNSTSVKTGHAVTALLYGSRDFDPADADSMESAGFIVAEDDACTGRRNFDLSCNVQSSYLYYELLDAASYRPYCPAVRKDEERYELLYKMLHGQKIEAVVFSRQLCDCRSSKESLEFLRVRLMRNGIDSVFYDGNNDKLRDYILNSSAVIADELS